MPGAPSYPAPRLRGDLIRKRPLGIEEEARPYAPEFGWYPAPRINRIGGDMAGAATTQTFPRTRTIGFNLDCTAGNNRSTASTPTLQGPAIIKGIQVDCNVASYGNYALSLGYQVGSLSENTVARSTPFNWTNILEKANSLSAGDTFPELPVMDVADVSGISNNPYPLGHIVNQPQFVIVIGLWLAPAAAGINIRGVLWIVEAVDAGALSSFL